MKYDRFINIHLTNDEGYVDAVFGKYRGDKNYKVVGTANRELKKMKVLNPKNDPEHLDLCKIIGVDKHDPGSCRYQLDLDEAIRDISKAEKGKENIWLEEKLNSSSDHGMVVSIPLSLNALKESKKMNDKLRIILDWVNSPNHRGKIRMNAHGGPNDRLSMCGSTLDNAGNTIGEWLKCYITSSEENSKFVTILVNGKEESNCKIAGLLVVNIAACWTGTCHGSIPPLYTGSSWRAMPGSTIFNLHDTLQKGGIHGLKISGAFGPTTTSSKAIDNQITATQLAQGLGHYGQRNVRIDWPIVSFSKVKPKDGSAITDCSNYETFQVTAREEGQNTKCTVRLEFGERLHNGGIVKFYPGLNGSILFKGFELIGGYSEEHKRQNLYMQITKPNGKKYEYVTIGKELNNGRYKCIHFPMRGWIVRNVGRSSYQVFPPAGWELSYQSDSGFIELRLTLQQKKNKISDWKINEYGTMYMRTSHSLTKCEMTT